MVAGKESIVKRTMLDIETKVRLQPGFVSGEVLRDTKVTNSYLILTEWESVDHLDTWRQTDFYKRATKTLNEVLQKPGSYRTFRKPDEPFFLL